MVKISLSNKIFILNHTYICNSCIFKYKDLRSKDKIVLVCYFLFNQEDQVPKELIQ